jgi:hypothetical protein
MRRGGKVRLRLVLVVSALALMVVPEAFAKPPTLLSVGHVERHPTATWSLPPGVEAKVAEVATSPQTASDGYFFSENVVSFDTLEPTQTSWTYGFQEEPGTYYVHIAGIDTPCFLASQCPVREFSQIITLVIPATPPPPPPVATAVLTVIKLGTGSGTVTSDPPGISCGSDCDESYRQGIFVTLTATPAAGSIFVGWQGVHCATSAICQVPMIGSLVASPRFDVAPPPPTPVQAPPLTPSPVAKPASVDTAAPRARALPSAGVAGSRVRLRFIVSDNSGRSRQKIVVTSGKRTLARVSRSMRISRPGQIVSVSYRLPARVAGSLRFCVVAWDRAGNASRKSCARLSVI